MHISPEFAEAAAAIALHGLPKFAVWDALANVVAR